MAFQGLHGQEAQIELSRPRENKCGNISPEESAGRKKFGNA